MDRFANRYDVEKTQAPPDVAGLRAREEAEKLMASERMQTAGCESVRDPIDDFFRYHAPTVEDLPKYAAINQAAKNFAEVVRANCPQFSPDYRDAIRKIREARMIANAAVALRGRGL